MLWLSLILMLATTALGANLAFARPRAFAIFLLPIGVLEFGADTDGLGGLANLSAIWLLCLIGLCIIAVVRLGKSPLKLSPTEIAYIVFLSWSAFESARATYFSYAVRAFLRLLFPFLSIYIARRNIATSAQAAQLIRWQFRATMTSAALFWGMFLIPSVLGLIYQLFWNGAVFFDHVAVMTMLALACWRMSRQQRYLIAAMFLSLICLRAVNRTTILALGVGGSVFCILEFRKLAVLMLPVVYAAVLAVLFTVPAFREKMFYEPDQTSAVSSEDAGSLSTQGLNSNGRFAMWQRVLHEFFWPNPILGSGLGSTQAWFYSGAAKEAGCGDLKVEHSEYVKLASDVGIIGLGLFVAVLLIAIGESIAAHRSAPPGMARVFALAGACAIPVFLVCMAFDNALLYVLPVAQYPLAFAAIGTQLAAMKAATTEVKQSARQSGMKWLSRRMPGERFADEATLSQG
jgi:hypothetical protein